MEQLYELPVSTLEPNFEHEPLGIIFTNHTTSLDKSRFGRKLSSEEVVQEIIKYLVKKAKEDGADGIFGLKINFVVLSLGDTVYQIYGTMIKRKL